MAALTEPDRRALHADWMRANTLQCSITKAELRAAVDAIDNWIDANAVSFNSSIPLPARTALTAKQKAWLFTFVVRRRFELS